MNRINATRKNRLSAKTSMRGEQQPRPAGLAAAIGSVLGIALPLTVWAGDAGSSITTDGNTATTVTLTAQDRWKVATATIKGRQPGNQVAFNSFKDFGVEAGQTVDLILPTKDGAQVHNLVNLVTDSRAYINGNLNGLLADESTVGGRVFFVDPHGLLVGKSGVLNVGSLSVATPTRAVMDDILAAGEGLDGLMYGTLKPEQLSRTGEVNIDGTINASNGVRVQARAIDVTGTILVAVAPVAGRDANSSLQRVDETAVNTGGAGAPLTLVNDGGKIQLRAAAISDTGLGVRSAEATVSVGGAAKLTADDIELTATAVVDSGYDKDTATFDEVKADLTGSLTDLSTLKDLGDALVNLGVDKVLGEQASFLHATTTARVEVKDTAALTARNDITLHASTRQNIDNSAAGTAYEKGDYVTDAHGDPVKDASGNPVPKKHLLSLGAAYAQINATTEAIIRSGATVNAGGDVSVKADADTAMKLAAESFAVNNTTAAFTAAISNVNVDTKAVIEAGSAPITAGSVNVSAVNTSSIETSATARADNQGAVGLAGAISLQDIAAEARLDRNVTTHATGGSSGDVTVQAASITSLNKTETLVAKPKMAPLPGQEQVEAISSGGDGLMNMAQSLAGAGIGAALGKLSGDTGGGGTGGGTTPTTPPKAAPFRLGGAISFVDGEHTAKASIGANTKITSAGDIVVDSQVIDAQIGNHAISNVLAKGKSADGSPFSLSGAITIANLEHDAQTLVGSGAQLSAAHIGLASDVRLPRDFSALTGAVPNFDSFDAFKDSLGKAKDLVTDPSDLFTSYSAAKGSAEEVAIGGAVSYFKAKNSARTDVASGASLKTTDTSGTPWTTALDGDDHAGDARTRTFDAATAISATTEITALHAAGDLALKNLKTSNVDKGGAALGGSVGYTDYENTAAAIVNDGVNIDAGAGSIAIDAVNKETIVLLALQSGQGGSIGVSGTVSALDLDSHTLAGVSNRATLTGSKIGISADEDMFVWSVAGAVAMSDSISVGASVAYQQMDTDTHAFIGAIPTDFKTGSSSANGQVNTGELSVTAGSKGLSGAVAAAGAIAKSSSEQLKQQQDALAQKQNAENPGFLDSLKTRALGKVTALESMGKKADSDGSAGLTQYFDKAKGLLGSGSGQGGQGAQTPQPKFGIALSGSATVNRARQNTKADISSAVVKDNSGNGVKLDIAAINKTLLVSISGALSVTAAGSDNNQGSASLAGGVAYGDIQNTTTAGLLSSNVQDAGDVSVTARNESEQVNVGLSVGVNASSDQTTAAAGAISATVAMSKNETAATLQGSTIQGKAGAGGDVDVKAVNESKIANGGGALYAGGKAGMGAAVTYAEIKDDTRAGISGGTISGVNDVRARAADASRIVAAAASGGASTQNNGVAIAGSVLVNQVANTTIASINDGATISFDGDLEAFAGTASISDVRSTTDGCESGAGVDYCGSAIGGIQVDANADKGSKEDTTVDAAGRNAGKSSIIAVAGMLQVGGNNAGVAFAYNTIKNTHAVSVNDATLTATSAGNIALTAADKADILAVSAGIGGSTGNFTGVGSASYNAIGNTTAVLVGSSVPGAQGAVSKAGATLNAGNITLDASDESFIGSFAGAATLGSKVAVGAALTINDIGNNTQALVEGANLDVDSGDVALQASNKAKILSGAVAAGAANNVAIQGSVGWSTIGNTAEAALKGGTLQAGGLGVHASNSSKVYTLAGAVAGSGTAAIGAAINVATIGDTTRASVDGTALEVTDNVDVTAAADATTKTLAIAGALAGTASIAGSNASNFINSTTEAGINNVTAQGTGVTGDVTVSADTQGKTYSLAGALAVGGTAGVGAASSVNSIGGSTTAVVNGAALNGANRLAIEAANSSLIRTAAVSGAGAGTAAVAGSVTTNLISSTTRASLVDSVVNNDVADVVVRARDERNIDSLAGSAAVAGSVGVGAAVAYNDIGGSTSAEVKGSALDLDVRNLLVSADASGAAGGNRIRTIAAGLGGGGAVGGAASVAVNRMQGTVSARIEGGADVLAQNNVGVLAAQAQTIEVFAGSAGVGANAGIGLGTVVNLVNGTTEAGIYGASTEVTALGNGDALKGVNSGERKTANVHSTRTDAAGLNFDTIDLGTDAIDVHGVVVNAATRQQVNTLGISGALGVTPIASGAVAVMAAVNQIAGSTVATIKDARINQHGLGASSDPEDASGGPANNAQRVDVRASHHVASANYVAGIAGSPGVFSGAGALSTNLFDSSSEASINGATVNAADGVTVAANASQNALAIAVGAAAGLVGGAATGVVNDFNTNTRASVVGGTLRSGSLDVTANSDNAASLVGGAGAAGLGAAVAGTALVNLGNSTTQARVGEAGRTTKVTVSRELDVSARSRSDFNGVAVSGALAGGAGVAGMAQVHLLENDTQAVIQNATVVATDTKVVAEEILRLSSFSGALGVGIAGTGVGAGASVAILGSSVRANVLDSDIQASGTVAVNAASDRAVEMVTMTGGAGLSTGIGGAASLLLAGVGNTGDSASELGGTFGSLKQMGGGEKVNDAALQGTLGSQGASSLNARGALDIGNLQGRGDLVQAKVSGGSLAAREVEITADSRMHSGNTVGGVGVGGLGVGGAFGMTGLYGTTEATLAAGSTRASSIDVVARAGDGAGGKAAELDVYAGAAGLVGVGAAVGIANLEQTVVASVQGDVAVTGQAKALDVKAADDSQLDVSATGMAAGAAAVGAVVAKAERDANVAAWLANDSVVTGFSDVIIDAASSGGARAKAVGAAGGVLAGVSAAVALADDSSNANAWLGDRSKVSGASGDVTVTASARPDVSAEAVGAAVAAGLAVGAAVADATSHTNVGAWVGANSVLANRGDLNVLAAVDAGKVDARAFAGSGGLYLAGAGAFATAGSSNAVNAEIKDGVMVHGESTTQGGTTGYGRAGDVSVKATNSSHQNAQATGISVAGLLAAGVVKAKATSDSHTDLRIGESAMLFAGDVVLGASGTDENTAKAKAGTGGLLAGNAALASTDSKSRTSLLIGKNAVLEVSRLEARAAHDARYGGSADSTSAGVLNASGANVSNVAASDVQIGIGQDAKLVSAGSITLRTDNNYNSTLGNALAVSAAGGGVLTGSAAQVDTELKGSSVIDVGSGALLRTSGQPGEGDTGALDVVANTRANTDDRAGLTTGGAINVAVVKASTKASLQNKVNIGANAKLQSSYMLNVGTYASTDIGANALVNTWGVLAAVGKSDADVTLDMDQKVNVAGGAKLESLHNAFVSAGQDGMNGWTSKLATNAVALGYSRGLIAIPDSSAHSTLNSAATTSLAAGSSLLSGAFVSLGSYGDNVFRNAEGSATGYNLGFIPVTVRDSQASGTTIGDVIVDGTVVAGRYNVLDIVINADGTLSKSGGGGDVLDFDSSRWNSAELQAQLNAAGIHDFDESAGKALNTWSIGDLYAAGGDIILQGNNIRGAGSMTAKGAPRITIVNNSNDNLLLAGDILIPDYNGGNILYTGNSSQANGIRTSENPGQGDAIVSIRNTGNNGSAIAAGGMISVTGGSLSIYNANGSINAWGEQLAENVSIDAPNGEVGYYLGSASWYGRVASSLWGKYSLASGITNPDDAAAYIANAQYGQAAANAGKSLTDYLLYQNSDSSNNNGTGSILIYGACNYRVGDKDCTESSLRGQFYDGGQVSKYSYESTNFLPRVNARNLFTSLSSQPGDVTSATQTAAPNTGSGINAGTGIKITANYIDVNVALKAGKPVDYSAIVSDSPALRAWIDAKDAQAAKGIFDVPVEYVSRTGGDSQRISLKYDSRSRQFIVPDIYANGGGSIYLDGRIVSTSTSGSLNVVSGKGSVVINNTLADVGLQLGNILVGNGAPGQITIRDRERGVATWYLRDSDGKVTGYQGGVNAVDWSSAGVTSLTSTNAYNPRAGMRGSWTQVANIRRNIHKADNGALTAENWRWVDAAGNTVYNGQQWTTSGVSYYNDAANTNLFDSKVTGQFDTLGDRLYSSVKYRCEGDKNSSGCRYNYGFPGSNQFDDGGTWRTRWRQEAPRSGRLTVTNTVKADNAIGINFKSNDAGILDVDSGQTIRINGVLKNTDGRTFLTSANGSIESVSNDARIITNELKLEAGKSIGSIVGAQSGDAANPIDIQMVSYTDAKGATVAAGSITAIAGGDIALDVDSAAKVLISAGNGSALGDVWLRAKYDIEGVNANTASITGGDITLYSTYGRIGSMNRPLVLRANEYLRNDGTLEGGLVTAKASGDIALRDLAGDFWVKRIESTAGDVLVDAASGSIFSASQRSATSFLSEEALASLRDNLKLYQGAGDQSIISYQSQVDASYAEYFQLRGLGSVSGGQFVAGSNAITLYRSTAEAAKGMSLDDAGVAAYLAERYARLTVVFADAFGTGWEQESAFTAGFNPTFRYDLAGNVGDSSQAAARKAQLHDSLTNDSQWTQDQLRYVFNANALEPSNGSALNAEPVIVGRNVTLRAKNDLGRLDKEYTVSLADVNNGLIGDDVALAMRLATTPGDVEMLDADGNVLTAQQIRDGKVVVSLRIKSTAPVVVDAKGSVDAIVGADTYLHGSSTLAFSRFESGGNARIGSDGDILGVAGTSAPTISVGKDLSLSALRSIMGDDGQPLRVQVNGTLLLANAGQHVKIAQHSGDLRIGIISANQDVVLNVADGSLLSYLKNVTAVTGRDIQLVVRDDILDETGAMLAVRIIAGGGLDGAAGGDVGLSSEGDMPIGTMTAGGDLQLLTTTGKLSADVLDAGAGLKATGFAGVDIGKATAGLDATVSAPMGDVVVGSLAARSAELNAGQQLKLGDADIQQILKLLAVQAATLDAGAVVRSGQEVQVEADGFTMGAGSRLIAGKVVRVRSTGDVSLGQVAISGNDVGNVVTLSADGRITSNGDAAVNIGGGSNVQATLVAGEGIGARGQALTVDVGNLVAASTARGDAVLTLPNGGNVGRVEAADGEVHLTAGGHVQVASIGADGAVDLDATSASVGSIVAGGNLDARTTGDLEVADAQVGGNVQLTSGGNLEVGTGTVGGNATLSSVGDTMIDTLAAQGSLDVTTGAALAARALSSGASMALSSGSTLDVQQLSSGGNLDADAVGTLSIVDAKVAGNAAIDGRADVVLGQAVVGQALAVDAGADLTAISLDVVGNSSLISGGNTSVTTFNGEGDLSATVGGDLALGNGTVGGNATLSSVGSTTIDTLSARGSLDATSGAALAARTLSSGASMALSSGSTLDVQQLTSGGNLSADAASTLSIADARVTGNAAIDGQADVVLGQAVVGQALAVDAGADLTAISLDVVGNSSLISGGSTSVTTFNGEGDLSATVGGDLALGNGTVGGNATLSSVGSTTIDTLSARGSLDATSGAALAAKTLSSGASMTLSSGDTLDVQQLTSGGNLDADAVGTLSIANAKVGGNATIDGQADVVLGQAVVGQALAVNAGNDLTATSLDVVGNSSLISGGNTSVTTFNGEGDLSATVGGGLALGNGTVGGNAALSSVGSTTIDTLSARGSLDATSGAALAARMLSSGASMTLSSGDTLDVQQLTSGANLDADAMGALSIADAKVIGNATVDGQTDVVLGQAVVGQALAVNAGNDLTATSLDVVGNSTLTSSGNTSVATFNGQGDLSAATGGDLSLGSGTVGGNATLSSVGKSTIDKLTVQGSLAATAGTALAARVLSSGASMTLSSGSTLDVQQLTSGGNLDADAVGTLSIADAKVSGNAAIGGQADVVLDQAAVGQALAVNAGNDLTATSLDVVGNSSLTSGGNTSVTAFNGQGDLSAATGGDLALGNGTVGGNATLSSVGSTTIDGLAAQGSLDANSGVALAARTLSSGVSMTLSSGSTLDVQQLTSGKDVSADAVGTLSIADTKVIGNATIDGRADVVLGQAVVGQALAVNAGNDLTATSLNVVGNSSLISGGNTSVTTFNGEGDLSAIAGSDLALVNGTVGGNATLSSVGSTMIDALAAQGSLDATSGAALAAQTLSSGASMTLASGSTLDVQQLTSSGDLDADAVGTLSIADAKVAGNANIDGQTDVVLGQAAVGQALEANAGNDLTATSLDVEGNSALISGANTSVTTFNGQGDLSATAGGDLALGNGTVGGNATLSSVGSTMIETLSAQGSLDATSGAALAARTLSSGASMTLSSSRSLDMQQLTSGGNLDADAVGVLTIANAEVTGNATLDGQANVVLGQVVVGQALAVNAGNDLTATKLDVVGNSNLTSGGSTSVTTFNGQGDLSATAGGDLALGNGTVGGNATLSSVGSTTIDTLSAQGSLDATSGAALAARTLSSGASMTLLSNNTLDVQQLTSGGDLNADAASTLSIADIKVTGDASIDGQSNVVLGQAAIGEKLAVNAGNDLTANTLEVTDNSILTSGNDMSVTTFNGQGDLTAKAGANATFDTVTVGGSMNLQAGKAIDVGTAVIGVDADWVAGTDLTANKVTTGCNFTGDAGGTLAIGSVQAGCSLQLTSNDSLSFDSLQAGTDIGLTSRRGDVLGRSVDAGGSLQVKAANAIGISTATAGTDITANSGGAQQWGSYRAGRDARLTAVGDVVTGSGDSGGLQSIISGGSIHFDRVQAGTTASMDAQGGSLSGGQLRAASGELAARDHLSLASAMVDTRLNLAATDIVAHIAQSSQGQGPLTTTLTGYRDGVAHRVTVEVDPRDAWLIDQIKAVDAQLASTAARADIAQGYIEKTMTLATSGIKVLMDNTSPVLRQADAQLMQLDKTFRLSADGTFLDTNAYVVRFADGFRVTSPNYNPEHVVGGPDYLGESAVRYMSRMLRLDTTDRSNTPASRWIDDAQEKDDVISSADGAVNLGAPN